MNGDIIEKSNSEKEKLRKWTEIILKWTDEQLENNVSDGAAYH